MHVWPCICMPSLSVRSCCLQVPEQRIRESSVSKEVPPCCIPHILLITILNLTLATSYLHYYYRCWTVDYYHVKGHEVRSIFLTSCADCIAVMLLGGWHMLKQSIPGSLHAACIHAAKCRNPSIAPNAPCRRPSIRLHSLSRVGGR